MNFLAHAYLSPPDQPGVLVGNVIADFVKGRARFTLPADLQRGFDLHRRIDTFTDTHPIPAHCADLLDSNWGRYAPVLVDIFFDHILAAEWAAHHAQPLAPFVQNLYTTLYTYRPHLPDRALLATTAMRADDWLTSYATLDGIALNLSRLSRRLRHEVELAPAVHDFTTHRAAFYDAFNSFWPELKRAVQNA